LGDLDVRMNDRPALGKDVEAWRRGAGVRLLRRRGVDIRREMFRFEFD